MNVADRLEKVKKAIAKGCVDNARPADSVCLLAISKGQKVDKLEEAYQAGLRAFGESYVAEAVEKMRYLSQDSLTWHFVGPIQSNKTKEIAEHFDWVQSVDRVKIARRLNEQRPSELGKLDITVQVNLFGEQSKQGCSAEHLPVLLEFINQQPNLRLRGLMALPPRQDDYHLQLAQFKTIAEWFNRFKQRYSSDFDTLSMGMSNDLTAAIAAGSTLVRVGTGIFGERPANWRKN